MQQRDDNREMLAPSDTSDATVARLALEWTFDDSYETIARDAIQDGVSLADLTALGHRIAEDAVRLARGDITAIVVPNRWPDIGEHRNRPSPFWGQTPSASCQPPR